MPTKQVVAKYINSGISKNSGKPYYNIKTPEDEVFWARQEITEVSQGARVTIDYTVGKNGSNNIVKIVPATNGAGNTSQYRAETPSRDAERMWTNAVLQRFIEKGDVSLDAAAIREATTIIRAAYHQSWDAPKIVSAKDSRPSIEEDMNDDIPY